MDMYKCVTVECVAHCLNMCAPVNRSRCMRKDQVDEERMVLPYSEENRNVYCGVECVAGEKKTV